VDHLVRCGLIRHGTEAGRPREPLHRWRQGLWGLAERNTEKPKYTDRREQGYERSELWNTHLLVFM